MTATLFDFNGVLVDDEAVHLAAFREALAPLGVTFDDDAYTERYLGFDDWGAFGAMLEDAGRAPTKEDVARLVEAKKPLYLRRAKEGLVFFDGAAALVRRRARRGVVGIVSGALRPEIELALDLLGVSSEVAFVVSAEDTERGKPDPEGYLLGLRALEARGVKEPGRAIVVEDSIAGVEAAKAAGLRCAAVTHSYAAERLAAAGADVVVGGLTELVDEVLEGAES